jgi:hypothetical protein
MRRAQDRDAEGGTRRRRHGHRVQAAGYGLRATGYGLRATGYGLRATGNGGFGWIHHGDVEIMETATWRARLRRAADDWEHHANERLWLSWPALLCVMFPVIRRR